MELGVAERGGVIKKNLAHGRDTSESRREPSYVGLREFINVKFRVMGSTEQTQNSGQAACGLKGSLRAW